MVYIQWSHRIKTTHCFETKVVLILKQHTCSNFWSLPMLSLSVVDVRMGSAVNTVFKNRSLNKVSPKVQQLPQIVWRCHQFAEIIIIIFLFWCGLFLVTNQAMASFPKLERSAVEMVMNFCQWDQSKANSMLSDLESKMSTSSSKPQTTGYFYSRWHLLLSRR